NPPAPMVALPQTDEQIASVLTYVRNSWGNKADAVTPEMVKALEGEKGQPMLTVADLIDPLAAAEGADGAGEIKLVEKPEGGLPSESLGTPTPALAVTGLMIALSIVGVLRMKGNKA
ncbi:MAG: hypothetical protein ACQKBY_05225, partial [Verrucomicrobiales bacterium]